MGELQQRMGHRRVIALGRREGKTTELLRGVADLGPVTILTPDGLQAEMLDLVRRAGLRGVQVRAFNNNVPLHGMGVFVFDNIDLAEEGIWHPALRGVDLRIVTCTIPSTRRRPWVDHPEKVTGIDLSDDEQLADAKPIALGDTAEELLEDEEETEEDEGRTADSP